MFPSIALFTLLGAIVAQAQTNSTGNVTNVPAYVSSVVIAGIEANFQNAQLTPQLFSNFTPQGALSFSFGNGTVSTGAALAQTAVQTFPTLSVYASVNSTNAFNNRSTVTVAMIDAGPVGTDESTTPQTRHWLVNGVSLSGAVSPYALNYTGSTAITDYAGPAPPANSGPHRYVLVVYTQPSTFTPPSNLTAGSPVSAFFFPAYVQSSGLGPLLAANYYTVESGSNSSISTTSAVVTSTLAGYSSAAQMTVTGSGTASGSGSASSAATTSGKSAAMRQTGSVGWGLVIGAMGVVGCVVGAGLGL